MMHGEYWPPYPLGRDTDSDANIIGGGPRFICFV